MHGRPTNQHLITLLDSDYVAARTQAKAIRIKQRRVKDPVISSEWRFK